MDKQELAQAVKSNVEQKSALPLWARWIIGSLLIILIILLLFFVLKPLRTYSSKKYTAAGDDYLANKKYLHADLAYEKALFLSPKNPGILAKRALAKEASYDIEKLSDLPPVKDALSSASAFPETEADALKLSKELIEKGEFQLAAIPAKTATEMDPGYRDAWLYLGIANIKTAQLVELSPETKQAYLDRAKEALRRAKEIDPESKIVTDYEKILK